MRLTAAFTAALITAAIVFDLEFLIEGFVDRVPLSLDIFVFGVVLNLLVGLPTMLVGAVPIWIVFRSRRVQSPWAFALAGAALGLVTYLLLVALGMGEPSGHPMRFLENLGRFFHIPRIGAAMVAGAGGAEVFWLIAVRRSFNSVAAASTYPEGPTSR
jgi:hypothetical protein